MCLCVCRRAVWKQYGSIAFVPALIELKLKTWQRGVGGTLHMEVYEKFKYYTNQIKQIKSKTTVRNTSIPLKYIFCKGTYCVWRCCLHTLRCLASRNKKCFHGGSEQGFWSSRCSWWNIHNVWPECSSSKNCKSTMTKGVALALEFPICANVTAWLHRLRSVDCFWQDCSKV